MKVTEIPSSFVPTAFDLFAHRVDMRFPEDVRLLGECGLQVFERIVTSRERNEIPERKPVYPLILNGLTTAMAALELWRRGLLLQVGILLRNATETAATAAVISSDKMAHKQYQQGEYNSTRAFSDVKKTWPVMGSFLAKVNGLLSDEFVHAGKSYQAWHRIAGLAESDIEQLRSMLLPVKVTFNVFDVLSEWVCWEAVSSPRYWKKVGPNAYAYCISREGQEWIERFFKGELPKATGQ